MNNLKSLQEIFNVAIFRIPDYQRGYSWSNQQLEEFWSDLIGLLPTQVHYTGMISLKKINPKEILSNSEKWKEENWLVNAGYSVFEVVDGQQRLTTLIILINEIIGYCRQNNITQINSTLLSEIEDKYLFKKKPGNIIRTYKFGYEEDNPSYKYFRYVILEEPNNGTIEETFYTLNLQNAKDFFKNKISKLIEKSGFVKLEEIYRKLTLQLKFNMYYIVDDFNVFVAFETMNNRGKRLSYLELLKNRLIYLSTLFDNDDDDKNKVREDINNTWKEIYGYLGKNKNRPLSDDEFLQNHWMIYFGHQTRKIQGNKTIPYHTFLLNKYFIQQNIDPNNMYIPDLSGMIFNEESAEELEIEFAENNAPDVYFGDDKQINLSLYEIQKYVNSLKELIQYWYDMYFPNEKYPSEMRKYLFRLNELGHVNARPLITVLLSKNNISDEEKIECLKNIERFNFLHYRLNGYSSTYSNSVFYNLARDLYYDTITINDVMNIVCRIDYLSDNNVIDTNGILEKFRKLFKRDGFYSWGTIKYLLYVYDISKTQTISEQRLDPTNYFKQDPKDYYSIEHIYPQKAVDIYWTERFDMYTEKERKTLSSSLGNLLPLSNRINSKLQNSSFDVKKERYSKGSRSEQLVAENKEWTPKIILERGLEILTFIEEEWNIKFPNLEHKKRILGLDFMIKENDITTDVNIPFYNEPEKEVKESRYDEEQFKKLVNNMKPEIMEIYADIDKYIMSLSNNVRKNTTSVYLAYTTTENFIELMFQTNGLKFIIMTGEYDDPRGLVGKLPDSYNWKNMRYIFAKTDSDLDYIKNILKQSYEMTLK